jgi:hypothetical protein
VHALSEADSLLLVFLAVATPRERWVHEMKHVASIIRGKAGETDEASPSVVDRKASARSPDSLSPMIYGGSIPKSVGIVKHIQIARKYGAPYLRYTYHLEVHGGIRGKEYDDRDVRLFLLADTGVRRLAPVRAGQVDPRIQDLLPAT